MNTERQRDKEKDSLSMPRNRSGRILTKTKTVDGRRES